MNNNIYSFEDEESLNFESTNSSISLSNKHFKDGSSSLCWNVEGKSSLYFDTKIGYQPFIEGSIDQARDTFIIWIYLEEKKPDQSLRFDFLKEGKSQAHFFFNLDFTGWRTAWVPYESMEGQAVPNMDGLRISTNFKEQAVIYIDQMIVCVPVDPRHHTRDKQVPFVNLRADKAANSHWMSLYRFYLLKEQALEDKSLENESAGDICIKDIQDITKRYNEYLLGFSPYKSNRDFKKQDLDKILDVYSEFNINIIKQDISGRTVNAVAHHASYPKEYKDELIDLTNAIGIKECSNWMLDVAYAWHVANEEQKEILGGLFVNVFRHLLDQGWTDGSGLGTVHHFGYPMRSYYKSIFLMKELLESAGYLEQASDAMVWYSGCGRIFRPEEEIQSESMDTLNTLLLGILASILTMKDIDEMDICLKGMQNWLSTCMEPAPGLTGPFKVDGSAFHHCNHYPAYAMGGFKGVAPVVYFLSGTDYAVGERAHKTLRKALLQMRIYSNTFNWLIGMSSRHPRGSGDMSQISSLEPFYYMALSGVPGEDEDIDKEMAEALLRMTEYRDYPKAKVFADMGYKAESNLRGHFTMNYACSTLHRRDHWLAGVRGHSRYIWGNETYLANNLYGRYIAYGNLQILSGGSPVNNKDSGFYQEGWDWNCWPGTTAVHLPWEELKADVRNVDSLSGFEEMLISDEKYAGGTSINGENGMFAMKLHGHGKYDSSHRARKSYFFFDDRIICIGTGIENNNKTNETRTTLFQNYLSHDSEAIYINDSEPITGLDTEISLENDKLWLKDNIGNAYYIPADQKVKITRMIQESRDQGSGQPTFAPFAKAWIDHGTSPKDDKYEYLIVVDHEESKDMGLENSYEVLQADGKAHIVKDKASNTIGYAFYQPCDDVAYGNVSGVDRESLIMEQMKDDLLHLSICDPDLRFYEGVEEDQLTKDGIQKEVSLYSRKWRTSPSIGKDLYIRLKGHWTLTSPNKDISISHDNENTIIKAFCIEAQPINISLKKYNLRDFQDLRKRWVDHLTGNNITEDTSIEYQNMIRDIDETAKENYDSLVKDQGSDGKRKTLWDDLDLNVNYTITNDWPYSIDFDTAYRRIYSMARAYATKASIYYKNDKLKKYNNFFIRMDIF